MWPGGERTRACVSLCCGRLQSDSQCNILQMHEVTENISYHRSWPWIKNPSPADDGSLAAPLLRVRQMPTNQTSWMQDAPWPSSAGPLLHAATGQDNWTLDISLVNTLAASIFTWLTPFTGQGMNKSRLVFSRGTLAKKRTSTWRRTAVFSCHRCPRGAVKNYRR